MPLLPARSLRLKHGFETSIHPRGIDQQLEHRLVTPSNAAWNSLSPLSSHSPSLR